MEPYTVAPYGFTTSLDLPGLTFRSAREKPFDLCGFCEPCTPGLFRRLPQDVARAAGADVLAGSTQTSGGRIRFRTDSSYVVLHAKIVTHPFAAARSAMTGSAGFDLYVRTGAEYVFAGVVPVPDSRGAHGPRELEQTWRFPTRKMRDVMIHFPLFSDVEDVWIGLEGDAALDHGSGYRFERPAVFCGASVTQGAFACRPGNAWTAILSRDCDCDFLNLGFCGCAADTDAFRSYIAGLDMSVLVLLCDQDASSPEHLRAANEPIFRAVRNAHPTLPVLFVSRPDTSASLFDPLQKQALDAQRDAVCGICRRAAASGDRYVWFIDGATLFEGPYSDCCTVDGRHPSDAGALRMADAIGKYVAAVLR